MWKAFKSFLEDFSSLDLAEIPSLVIWEHYLVYATVLGIAKRVLDQLSIVYPEIALPGAMWTVRWATITSGPSTARSLLDTIDSITQSLHTSVSHATMSSGAGRGGGFSGGGEVEVEAAEERPAKSG